MAGNGPMSTAEKKGWNPRFVEYAAEQGRTPEEQTISDREAFPGGCMTGFILWIGERWTEWAKLRGRNLAEPTTGSDHLDFDRWLAGRREKRV